MDKCDDKWNTNISMNECHTNFPSFYTFVCQICFQCTIYVCDTYKLWINEFHTICIIKLWGVKFLMECQLKNNLKQSMNSSYLFSHIIK
jgi:hypothetical protein